MHSIKVHVTAEMRRLAADMLLGAKHFLLYACMALWRVPVPAAYIEVH